jgi:hypothetical protein
MPKLDQALFSFGELIAIRQWDERPRLKPVRKTAGARFHTPAG